ncbi:MAG: hypothetical protein QNI97_17545 [Desulfobacterales bacterium]|nr:hypothetical protein [Desulfobacterales bacterium]MDJ0989838.1 hypothetical protein [Desulfobacterales bacterium]
MAAFYSLIIFFFILVIFYSGVAAVLALAGWVQKARIQNRRGPSIAAARVIEARIDDLKTRAFPIAVVLVLFCITPFVVILLVVPR